MTKEHIEQQRSLAEADRAEDLYVRQEQEKQEARLRAEFRAKQAKAKAEAEKRAQEDADVAAYNARRNRLDDEREGQWKTPPAKIQCAVCGNDVISTVAAHRINNDLDLCVRNAKAARLAGRITKEQYQIIVNAGHEESGHIFTDSLEGSYQPTGYEHEATTGNNVIQTNPLTNDMEYSSIKHATPVA